MTAPHLSADEPAAYLFKVIVGPTYRIDDHEPVLRLLSQRFTEELWAYGSYQADITYGRAFSRCACWGRSCCTGLMQCGCCLLTS